MEDHEVEMVQRMFKAQHEIAITFEQAKEIYKYEKLRDTPSSTNYFSIWEGLDFELVSFQKILNEEQFNIYKKNAEKNIAANEEQLIVQDKNYENQLKANQDLLDYYLAVFVPSLEKKLFFIGMLGHESGKLIYLKAEYKKYLDDKKKSILVNHFRHSKTFQPLLLELSLLVHQFDCLIPNYQSFKEKMDLPTKAIADHLLVIANRMMLMPEFDVKQIFEALTEFKKENALKHLGELKGWHITIAEEPFNLMPVLLMDSKMYSS